MIIHYINTITKYKLKTESNEKAHTGNKEKPRINTLKYIIAYNCISLWLMVYLVETQK